MKSHFNSRIRYSEVDENRNLTLKAAVDYMQDACTFQSEDIGEGLDRLDEQHLAWLLASWQIEVLEMPRLFDEVVISTWPHKIKGYFAYRCHSIESPEGKVYVRANSIWFMMDRETEHPVKIGEEQIGFYTPEDRLDMPFASRRVRIPKDAETEILPSRTIRMHQIDMNGHVNNSQYIQMAEECLPAGYSNRDRVRVEYVTGARLGDEVVSKICYREEKAVVELTMPDGRIHAAVEFS